MAQAQGDSRRIVVKRHFYPCVLAPTEAEKGEHKRRRRQWFPEHKEIWKRTEDFKKALRYLSKPSYFMESVWFAVGYLVLGLGSFFLWQDPITKAMRNGFIRQDGGIIAPVNGFLVAALFLEGALGVFWFMCLSEKKKRNESTLVKERFREWILKPEVTQENLQSVLLPYYATPNPFDPTDPDINMVLGEYYDNDAHKFGPTANWYTMKMKGLQAGGVVIFGITGSGKTSSMLKPLMRQVIGWMAHVSYDPNNKGREKVSGFIVDPKGSLAVDTRSVMNTAGIDPILDPAQLTKSGPANVTALYYLMHKKGGKKNKDGKYLLNPDFINGYRGRADDYLELGYDELKVDKVWAQFEAFQKASTHLVGHNLEASSVDSQAKLPKVLKGGVLTIMAPVDHSDGKEEPYDLKGFLAGRGNIPRRDLANLHAQIEPVGWERLNQELAIPMEPLGKEVDDLLRWIWVGRKVCSLEAKDHQARVLDVHPMIPGLPFSIKFSLDAYAISRNLIRRLAPTKQRPTSGIREYRDVWAWREVRLWEFKEHQVQVAKRAMAAAQMLTLVRRFPSPRLPRQEQERAEAYGAQMAHTLGLLSQPLAGLLGEGSVGPEYHHPKVKPTKELEDAIERIRVSLDNKLSAAIKAGDYQALTVPSSERPKPDPVDEATRKKQGGRYSAPDPMVDLSLKVADLRKSEWAMVQDLVGEAKALSRGASEEVGAAIKGWGVHLDEKIVALGKKPVTSAHVFLEGALAAVHAGSGDLEELAADLVATLLGMSTIPTEDVRVLMSGFLLRAYGDKGAAFGLQAAHGALNPLTVEPWRFLNRASDAVVEEWTGRTLAGVLTAAHAYLVACGLNEEERNGFIGEVRTAVKGVVDGWIHAHVAVLEGVLERDEWRVRLEEMGKRGKEVFTEADRLDRLGAMVACVEDSLVTDARDRIPMHPNVEWGSLFWAWATSPSGARTAPFWRGPMGSLDMTPLHVSQWDPAWSSITWRMLGYCLNAAPPGINQLDELAKRGIVLGLYHQAALESYVMTVAPNIGWRTDGPFSYNCLYAPDLAPIVVAGTFNQTVFAATSEGKDSGDPFWENASFTVVFNLLNLLQHVDGYATFPKIDALVTQEATLRDYVSIIRERVARRDGSPEDIEVMSNILKWVDGEWLTEAASKSETKDNIVRSLSVVTQPFKEPRFAVCFAPAAKEDISFPSWTWVMREGKIVCANLPWEKYEKVAKVVLPLANKTCQKAVQMRDGARGVNAKIEANNRKEIEALWKQAGEMLASISQRAAERLVLMMFFQRELGIDQRRRLVPTEHLLLLWRHALNEKTGVLRAVPCMGDVFMRQASLGSANLDTVGGFVAGALGMARPLEGSYLLVPRAVQTGIEAGFFVRMLMEEKGDPGSDPAGEARSIHGERSEVAKPLKDLVKEGNDGARKLIEAFGTIAQIRMDEDVAKNLETLGFSSASALADAAGNLPGLLVQEYEHFLNRQAVMRWTSRMEQYIHDERGGDKDGGGAAAGAALRPRARLRAIFRKIMELEAQIAEMPNTERPFLYMVDECHFFCQKDDAQYVSVARSNNALNFYSTQSPNALMARMDESAAKQFLDNLPNRIILRMPDSKAAESCAEYLGGKVRRTTLEKNVTQSFGDVRADTGRGGGQGKSEGGSVSVSIKEEERWIVELNQITGLQAFEAFAMVWDGKKTQSVRRVYTKPDYLYVVPVIRNYKRVKGDRYGDLPKEYKDGTDLYTLPVPRLLELGVIDASR